MSSVLSTNSMAGCRYSSMKSIKNQNLRDEWDYDGEHPLGRRSLTLRWSNELEWIHPADNSYMDSSCCIVIASKSYRLWGWREFMKIIRKGGIGICNHALDSENRENNCKSSILFHSIAFYYVASISYSTFIFELCNLERYPTREEKSCGFAGRCVWADVPYGFDGWVIWDAIWRGYCLCSLFCIAFGRGWVGESGVCL